MCLIVVGWRVHPDYPLIVAANRDEFYRRPTANADYWPEAPTVVGGRDLEAGGTWLGISKAGRFAAVTNVREPGVAPGRESRGQLTRRFLLASVSASDYAHQLAPAEFSGFNLLVADGQSLIYLSNRDGPPQPLAPGVLRPLESPARQPVAEAAHCPSAICPGHAFPARPLGLVRAAG